MRIILRTNISMILVLLVINSVTINAQFDKFLEKLGGLTKSKTLLSNDKVVDGLKEALKIGSKNAVSTVSVTDGFFKNEAIKILLPKEIQKIEKTARRFGLGNKFDELILAMNRAAEQSAKDALPIFTDALVSMTISDGLKILNGAENEATKYFREKTYDKLYAKFQPHVQSSINAVGVTQIYNKVKTTVNKIPFVKLKLRNLDTYVTEKALDGLFYQLAAEELKIRKDPAARVTDLLKDVFGGGK